MLERPLPYCVTHAATTDPINVTERPAMGDPKQKVDLNWRLDDLAQEHAEQILVEVMSRRNYAGETLVQLVEALRAMEQQAHTTRQDVAKRLADEQERKARDAKKRAERKKAAGE